jgi:hypothetical protein
MRAAKRVWTHNGATDQERRVWPAHRFDLALAGIPELAHVKAYESALKTKKVIRMRMGKDAGEERVAPARAQDRAEHARADVDRTADEAAAVDDNGSSIGQIDDS